jgi:hypothetical protein
LPFAVNFQSPAAISTADAEVLARSPAAITHNGSREDWPDPDRDVAIGMTFSFVRCAGESCKQGVCHLQLHAP